MHAEGDALTVAEFPQIAAQVDGYEVAVPEAPVAAPAPSSQVAEGPALIGDESAEVVRQAETGNGTALGIPAMTDAGDVRPLEEIEADIVAKNPPAVTFLPDISFDEFIKVDMTVVKVLACENVKKSKKLLKFQLNDGSGTPRQILSGIAEYYKAEDLVGKTLVAVTNLPPRKMMGQESNGMIISAEKDEKLTLLMLDDNIPAGAKLC